MPGIVSSRPARIVRSRVLLSLTGLLLVAGLLLTSPVGATAHARGRALKVDYFFVSNPNARPFWITAGPDGNMWFTDTKANAIGRITPKGVITEFDIGAGKLPYGITAGADGNLWFSEQTNNHIGAINTQGHLVHEYSTPGTDPRPTGITTAPNGDIWFTEPGPGDIVTNSVGRLTSDGIVHTYDSYPCACFMTGITTGPDGNLWAVEEEGVAHHDVTGTLDRITPDGQHIFRDPLPLPPVTPAHLPAFDAPGPDGNVWFTEFAADVHMAGKVTPAGHITEYPLPGSITNSVGVTTGIDGRVWITQGDAGDIVVLNTDGSVVTTIPTHQGPDGIAIGPDGNMWFATSLDEEIGRVHTALPGHAYVLDIAPGFSPSARTIVVGETVRWVLEAPGLHRVVDATGAGLFDSGFQPPVSFLDHTFTAAGRFPFRDQPSGALGVIAVRPSAVSTGHVGSVVNVTWASSTPARATYDVQVRVGSGAWRTWRTGTASASGSYTPSAAGTYSFRSRPHGASDWSPAVTVRVA